MRIRKLVTIVEEIRADGQRETVRPVRKAAAVAVVENPFAGRFEEDLSPLVKVGEELGALLGKRAVEALGGPAESYGKAAVVGLDGVTLRGPDPRSSGEQRLPNNLHITVDDLPWLWADASDNNTVDIAGLPPGQHKVKIELVDANHKPFPGQVATLTFTVPAYDRAKVYSRPSHTAPASPR